MLCALFPPQARLRVNASTVRGNEVLACGAARAAGRWKRSRNLKQRQIGVVEDYGSFAAFGRRALSGEVTDTVQAGQRAVTYARSGVQLALSHSVLYDGLKYALVGGQPVPHNKFQLGTPA